MKTRIVLGVLAAVLLVSCGSAPAVSNPTIAPATIVATAVATILPTSSPVPATTIPTVTTAPSATLAPTDAPTIAPAPTVTTVPTTAPVPTAVAAPQLPLRSGGLGLTRAEWETRHGAGILDPALGYVYEDKRYFVFYQADPSGVETVWNIEQRFGVGGISTEDARAASVLLLPLDRKLTKTYTATEGRTVDLYRSTWLKGRFPSSQWVYGKPGDFIVLYRTATGNATSIVIGVDDNP